MNGSLRCLSLLILLCLLLTSLSSLHDIITLPQHPTYNYSVNSNTLLSLSAQPDVSDLLRASIGSFGTVDGKYRTIYLFRPIESNRHGGRRTLARLRLPVSSQAGYPPERHVILPLFRQSLSKWARYSTLKFSNSLTEELIQQVKNPIEIFNGRPETDTAEQYATCAVVGNSGILLGSKHGELIDSHEFVIRLNNARISGYEKDVGSKTNLSFVNSNVLNLCTRKDKCQCHPYGESVPILMYICQPKHFLDFVICNSSHNSPLIITDPRFDKLCARIAKYYSLKRFVDSTGQNPTRWNKKFDEKTFHYSSGFQAVMLGLGICKRVSIFGFGKLKGAKHHYHTNQKAELALHDYEAEYMFYDDLIRRPEMIPFFEEFQVPQLVFYH
ncbi:hypothetical protein LUZ60_007418 [Juncus effusus]|nr:hypothetical protein LUZ60_007418 [Juncus effusus]